MKKAGLVLFLLALLISTLFRFLAVRNYNFPFTMDQGRDLIDIRHIYVTHAPRLIGPTTSINGLFLGPFWYYFNLPPFLLSSGDPGWVMLWQIFWYQVFAIVFVILFKKINQIFAYTISTFYLIAPLGFDVNHYFWNANAMPMFTFLYLTLLLHTLLSPSTFKWFALAVLSGLCLQIEAAFGILFFPFLSFVILFQSRKLKTIFALIFGFLITLSPQIIFEFRHSFTMTNLFLREISGGGMLGQKLTLTLRLEQRWNQIVDLATKANSSPRQFALILMVFSIIYLLLRSNRLIDPIKKNYYLNLGLIIFAFVFYLIFPLPVKGWYLLGLGITLINIPSLAISDLLISKHAGKFIGVLIIVTTLFFTAIFQLDRYRQIVRLKSNDPSNLRNEITAIDWVYQHANNQAFSVYNYLPSVYDYPYQYVFWWYGTKEYQYQPANISYLPNQPEYIKDHDRFWTKKRPITPQSATFLIIERDEQPQRRANWLAHFSSLCVAESITLPWETVVEKRIPCQ